MNNFLNKVFNKSKTIKTLFLSQDRKLSVYHVKPDGTELVINHLGVKSRYAFDPSKIFITRGGWDNLKPTVFLIEGEAEALDPFKFEASYDAVLFETAMTNNLVKDIVRVTDTKKVDKTTIMLFIIMGLLIVTLLLIFNMSGANPTPEDLTFLGGF